MILFYTLNEDFFPSFTEDVTEALGEVQISQYYVGNKGYSSDSNTVSLTVKSPALVTRIWYSNISHRKERKVSLNLEKNEERVFLVDSLSHTGNTNL